MPFDAPAQNGAGAVTMRCVRVVVRKRPFFPKRFQKGVFDVISCLPIRVVIHDARMHADMRRMLLSHQDFAFDDVFEDNADNDALPLRVALAPC